MIRKGESTRPSTLVPRSAGTLQKVRSLVDEQAAGAAAEEFLAGEVFLGGGFGVEEGETAVKEVGGEVLDVVGLQIIE
jgi:hypothetical protein